MAANNQQSNIAQVGRRTATIANLILQFVAVGFSIINGIVLVPLYLKYIDFKLLGAWLATGSIIGWLGMVDAGISELIRQQTAKALGSKDLPELGRVMATGMFCNVAVGIFPVIIGIICAPFLGMIFHLEASMAKELIYSFVLASLSCSFVIIGGAASAALQGLQRNVSVCIIFVISSLIGIVLTIWMLLNSYSVLSIPAGLLVRGIVWTAAYWGYAYYLSHFRMGIAWCFSRKHLGGIVNLTSWTSIYKMSFEIISQSDALVVGLLMGVETTPVYVYTRRSWDMLQTFLNRIGVAFMPSLAHLHGEGDQEKFVGISRRLLRYCTYAVILMASICLAMNKTFVNVWLGPELYAGRLFDVIMAAAIIIFIYNWTINSILYASGVIRQPAKIGIGQNIFRAILLVFLVWFLKINGTVTSMFVGALVVLPYFLFQWQKMINASASTLWPEYRQFILSALLLVTTGCIVSLLLPPAGWVLFIIIGLIYSLTALIILAVISSHFRKELQLILEKILGRYRTAQ